MKRYYSENSQCRKMNNDKKGDSCQRDLNTRSYKIIGSVGQNQSVKTYTNQKTKIQGVAGVIFILFFQFNLFFYLIIFYLKII